MQKNPFESMPPHSQINTQIEKNPDQRESIQMNLIIKLETSLRNAEAQLASLTDSTEDYQKSLWLKEEISNSRSSIESAFQKLSEKNQKLFLQLSQEIIKNPED